ncbi:hypothetical protein [Streptomyces malaysiensis]|uniref:Protein NO VEIN C-terminal domain-containing protein n=1 Tax=Streptomyces malaysiensis TaxID=92644 RepID=A0A7X5X7L2_STRMQ|nr:hypothetical protein [Streptomyces malaysiensis]NIY68022.1 hypothetical protein [Streptomyces malaysiensis]
MDRHIKASRNQEKKLAKDIRGTTIAGSGSGWAVKNDVRNDTWSIECKTTAASRFSLTHAALVNAEKNALLDLRTMAFAIEMCKRTWIVISQDTFLRLIDPEEDT